MAEAVELDPGALALIHRAEKLLAREDLNPKLAHDLREAISPYARPPATTPTTWKTAVMPLSTC